MAEQKIPNFTESEAKCIYAESLNDLLVRIYQHIEKNGFNTDLFLEDFQSEELINFGIATTGFLSVQNFEQLIGTLKDSEIDNIIGGTFNLKKLSYREAADITRKCDAKPTQTKNKGTKTPLYKIQDSSYSIVSKNGKNTLVLKTPEVEYFTTATNPITTKDVFHMIRNLTAHSTSYKAGSKIIFYTEDGYLELPRMWFRGYSELFVNNLSQFDTEKAKTILHSELPKQGNYLESFDDINKALSAIKGLFDKEIVSNFFRVNNFVKYRLTYQPDFFERPLEEKIEILVQIIEKNPNYLTKPSETINPSIIYNLQQLVSRELAKRDVKAQLNSDDPLFEESEQLAAEYADFQRQYNFVMQNKNPKPALLQHLIKKLEELDARKARLLATIENREKLESAHMELYSAEELEFLPIEVAVNVIALMAYNSLVTSGYYEDVLSTADYKNLSTEHKRFVNGLNLDELTYHYQDKKFSTPFAADNKYYILSAMRNAICHGLISYELPTAKKGEAADFTSAKITFYLDREDIMVSGTVESFFKLLSSAEFFKTRPESMLSKPIAMMKKSLPDLPKFPKFSKAESSSNGPKKDS